MRLRFLHVWVCVLIQHCQEGHALRNRVYIEADKNCGQVKLLNSGEHYIVGSKHGGQEILKENCEITFKLADENSREKVCIEFEQLDFKGNCFASLTVVDILREDEGVFSENQDEKQIGLYTCMWEPPMEICSAGQSLKVVIDRGYHILDRELVVFLLDIYSKNPDAPPTDSPYEEENDSWFFGGQPAPILLLVIIALCLVITITATVIVICMRLKSRLPTNRVPVQHDFHPPNASALTQDARISTSPLSSYEYYQMQALSPNNCNGDRLHPTAPYISQPNPSCVYRYHRLNNDSLLSAQHRCVDRPGLACINRTGFPSQGSVAGFTEPISERSVSPNDLGYSTEPASHCYYSNRNPCVLHGYSGVHTNCRVLQGYYSYPGLQYMGLTQLPCNYGNRAGEEDADESDISDCEGRDGASKGHTSHPEDDFVEKTDKVKWAQMGVL